MFDGRVESDGGCGGEASHVGWREIDRRMRVIARRRAALDAEEAVLLMAAKRAEVHKQLGYGSLAEYLGRACGYSPGTVRERMRVAEALEALPAMREALAAGTVTYSTVRELTRFVDAETEDAWIAAVEGCTARDVEELTRARAPGDLPDDRPHEDLEPRRVRMDLLPPDYALFLEARRHLEQVTGEHMTDAEFMRAACLAVLGGNAAPASDNEPPHQVAITVCADCQRGWHDAPGRSLPLPASHVERMRCDAVELGRVDGEVIAERVRTIPAPIRRAVLARDHHRCTVPGCTSSLFVDLHHLHPWSQGGDHAPSNLTTLCSPHHDLAHDGRITIAGTPGSLSIFHADGRPYGMPAPTSHVERAPAPSPTSDVGRSAAPAGTKAMQLMAVPAQGTGETSHVGRAGAAARRCEGGTA